MYLVLQLLYVYDNMVHDLETDDTNSTEQTNGNSEQIPESNQRNFNSINKTFLVSEYIIGTTKLLLEIIKEFDNMNIDYPLSNSMMEYDYKINKMIKYINATKKDGIYNLDKLKECSNSKCKKFQGCGCVGFSYLESQYTKYVFR